MGFALKLPVATSCRICLLLAASGAVFGQATDSDVRAARVAERREALKLAEHMSVSTEAVEVTAAEIRPQVVLGLKQAPEVDTPAPSAGVPADRDGAGPAGRMPADRSKRLQASPRRASRAASPPVVRFRPSQKPPMRAQADTDPPTEERSEMGSALPPKRPDKVVLLAQMEQSGPTATKEGPGLAKTVLSTAVKLAVVLVLAYLTIVALKWVSLRRDVLPHSRRDFKIMDSMRLSSTSSLHLVDVKGKQLLVGCSNGQVSLLREFENDNSAEAESPSDRRFAEYLAEYSGTSGQGGPARRIGRLLRDCSAYLRDRQPGATKAVGNEVGVTDET